MASFYRVSNGLWICLLLISGAAARGEDPGRWLVYPCVKAGRPPVIDGRLDDEAWKSSVPVSGFRYSSAANELVPWQMVMRVCWHDDWLYMAVEVEEPSMDKLVITARARDAYVFNDDSIEWFLDPAHTHDDYYQFGLNAAGAMWDAHVPDVAWDCDWRAAVARLPDAWHAEVGVPLSAMTQVRPKSGTVWGFNLCHERQAGGQRELINWANVFGNFHRPQLFGHLLFVSSLDALTPELLVRVASEVGRPAVVYVPQGWWLVENAPRLVTYREDLNSLLKEQIGRALSELLSSIDRETEPQLWEQCRDIRSRWREARRLADRADSMGPLEWAHARVAVQDIERQLPDLLWQVRLEALIRSL
ncbi:MAG: hypothetical protein H5T86_05335 [Armatimonadetes bacterium]|nr:hypothetical protein [Armatimonadota bacterium]